MLFFVHASNLSMMIIIQFWSIAKYHVDAFALILRKFKVKVLEKDIILVAIYVIISDNNN